MSFPTTAAALAAIPLTDDREIDIDGGEGEGGGQIVRSAITLGALTGRRVRIDNVRAGRAKPGLLRQHLTAARAAAEVSGGSLRGDELRSSFLEYIPGQAAPKGGEFVFRIGSAGSTGLVLQTIAPILFFAEGPSTVFVEGGTHNMAAPTADFLDRVFAPMVEKLGFGFALTLERHGFYPAGGGRVRLDVTPRDPSRAPTEPLILGDSPLRVVGAEALISQIPKHVARRELATVKEAFGLPWECLGQAPVSSPGPGNVLQIVLSDGERTELITGFGRRSLRAEEVAAKAIAEARALIESGAPVGEYLADQLLLPLALTGGGSFRASVVSEHTRTQARLIERFLRVEIAIDEERGRITVRR